VRRRGTGEESPHPFLSRSQQKAWNPFSLVHLLIQVFKMMMRKSHGIHQQERRHALDNSLSSFSRLSSSAEPEETRKEEKARKRREKLIKELEDEDSDLTLSDDSSEEKDSGSRKLSPPLSFWAV
jgi:hypothetical protein